jgi:hypothetical protein
MSERYLLVLRAEPGEVPAIHRLRAALKHLLRTHGLRAERVEDVTDDPLPGDEAPSVPSYGRTLATGTRRSRPAQDASADAEATQAA